MKNPFAILLTIVVLLGIAIGGAAIVFIGPTNQDDDADAIPIASESDLPTPSTRNEAVRSRADTAEEQSAVVVVSTSVTTKETSSDELPPEIQERIESGEGVVVNVEASGETSGRGRFGDGAGFGGGGGPNIQAIQEAIENNPEIQELIQNAQSGNMSQADQARLQELMQEALAEAGIEAPVGRQGGGFGAPPTQGTVSAISGSTLTIDHNDDSGLSTDIEITDNTNINVIKQLTPADLSIGTNVAGTVQRGEGGRIFIINLAIIPEPPTTVQGFGRGFMAPLGLFGTSNDAINLSTIDGTIAEINDSQISVETTQGTLRLSTNEASTIISTNPGTISDITQGMAAIALGGNPPNNLIIGPEILLQQDANTPSARAR